MIGNKRDKNLLLITIAYLVKMKTLIFILTLLSFLQATVIPLDLVLIFLMSRAMVLQDKENLYFAFGFGLLISFLTNTPLGFYSLLYLCLVQLVSMVNKMPITGHFLVVVPITFVGLCIKNLALDLVLKESFMIWPVIIGTIVSLLIYFGVKFWEERFIIKHDVRLKI